MLYVIGFVVMLLSALVALVYMVIGAIRHRRVVRSATALGVCMLLCGGLVWLSQSTAHTPAITGEESIAELRRVTLNGRREWISVRGRDKTAPLLLFLAGGPGGSQMAAVRHELGELEDYFVVVNWDQPGAGKSYGVAPIASLTPQTYIDDGIELTRQLCAEFGEDKILLMGESWGSALGVFLIEARPDLYRAFIGTGQMVAFEETERIDYQLAMDMAEAEGNIALTEQLRQNGEPPYFGSDVTWKSAVYLNYLSSKMARNPQIRSGGYNTVRDLMSEEYGLIDKLNYVRGIIDTFNQVYPQLYPVDLRKDYTALRVPVYFFHGRHDLNAPASLVEDYYTKLSAPEKQLVWFERSGHSPWINETDVFVQRTLELLQPRLRVAQATANGELE